jgi:hypothetical protein
MAKAAQVVGWIVIGLTLLIGIGYALLIGVLIAAESGSM